MISYGQFRDEVLKDGIFYQVSNINYSQVTKKNASFRDLEELYRRYQAGGERALTEGSITQKAMLLE